MLIAVRNRIRARGNWKAARSAHSADQDLALRRERDRLGSAAGGAADHHRQDKRASRAELGDERTWILGASWRRSQFPSGSWKVGIDRGPCNIRVSSAVHRNRADIIRRSAIE